MPRLAALTGLLMFLLLPATAFAGGTIIRDAEIERDLRVIATPIFQQAGVSPDTVRFIIIDNHEMNAFVAGGQNIFLYTGLIQKTRNAAELAGVIAHETGHISLGHLFRAHAAQGDMSVQALLSSVLGIATGIATHSGAAGLAIARAGQGMAVNSMLSHTRTQESSADQAGTRFLSGADMPATGFLSFMGQLKNQELLPATAQSEYVRTHPLTQDRVDFLQNVVDTRAAAGRPGRMPGGAEALHGRIKAKLLGYLEPTRALQDKSDSADAQYARAIAWYRQGQTDRALAAIDKMIAATPQAPYLYELKGQVLFEGGRVKESVAPYARAVELVPKAGLIRVAYGRALMESGGGAKKSLEDAIRQFTLSLSTEPREPSTHYFLAMAYGKLGDEGQSRLHLAEQYLLQNRLPLASREGHLALKSLPPRTPSYLRVQDILAIADKKENDKKEKEDQDDEN